MERLGPFPNVSTFETARGVSADGSVIVANGGVPWDYNPHAFRLEDGVVLDLGPFTDPTDDEQREVEGVSADGSVAVGQGVLSDVPDGRVVPAQTEDRRVIEWCSPTPFGSFPTIAC